MEAWITLLVAVNIVALGAMGIDKRHAARGRTRVPERTLCFFAALGGAPGIWAGRTLFRHKSRKRSFLWKLIGATAVNAVWAALAFALWEA